MQSLFPLGIPQKSKQNELSPLHIPHSSIIAFPSHSPLQSISGHNSVPHVDSLQIYKIPSSFAVLQEQ